MLSIVHCHLFLGLCTCMCAHARVHTRACAHTHRKRERVYIQTNLSKVHNMKRNAFNPRLYFQYPRIFSIRQLYLVLCKLQLLILPYVLRLEFFLLSFRRREVLRMAPKRKFCSCPFLIVLFRRIGLKNLNLHRTRNKTLVLRKKGSFHIQFRTLTRACVEPQFIQHKHSTEAVVSGTDVSLSTPQENNL